MSAVMCFEADGQNVPNNPSYARIERLIVFFCCAIRHMDGQAGS